MEINTLLAMPKTTEELADIAQLEFIQSSPLKFHKYSNCKISEYKFYLNGDKYYVYILTSYKTEVCGLIFDNFGNHWVYYTGLYSKTTKRQITWFLREKTTFIDSCTQLKKLKPGYIYPIN